MKKFYKKFKSALFRDFSAMASSVMKGANSKPNALESNLQSQENYNMSIAGSRESLRTVLNSTFASTAGVFFIDIDSDLRLKGLVHQDVFTDWIVLSSILRKHYFRDISHAFIL